MRRSARGRSDWRTTAVEFGLMVALVAAAATGGRQVFTMYNTVPSF
jgi:Flp pilus assembly pilin Flp